MKKHFYQQPIIVIMNLRSSDTIMTSEFGDNQVFDSDII